MVKRHSLQTNLELERYRQLVESSGQKLLSLDRELRYQVVSPDYAAMFCTTPEQLRGRFIQEIVPDTVWQVIQPHLRAVLQGETRRFSVQQLFPDGVERYLEVEHFPFRVGDEIQGAVITLHDATETRLAQLALQAHQAQLEDLVVARTAELQAAEAQMRLILESTAEGLYGVDVQGRASFVNPAACQMLRGRQEELVGRPLHSLVRQPSASPPTEGSCPLLATLAQGNTLGVEEDTFWRLDGQPFPVSWAARPMIQDGQIVGAVVSFTDISDRRATEAAREAALMEARRLAQVRSDFLANMSHEIRTPLNTVLGAAQLGRRESGDVRTQENFSRILDAGQFLLGLVDDVLDFSRIEAGKLSLENQPFELGEVIDRAINLIAPRAYDKGLRLQVEEDPALPSACRGDSLRLAEILVNLLTNAVKFTEAGQVRLTVFPQKEGLLFRVEDSGVGIAPDQLARLFSPFEQGDGSTTRRFGGTGLGLSICSRLTQLMGGTLDVTSQLGQGTTFDLYLPLSAVSPPFASLQGTTVIMGGLDSQEAQPLAASLQARGAEVMVVTPAAAFAIPKGQLVIRREDLEARANLRAVQRAISRGQGVLVVCTPGTGQTLPPSLREGARRLERPLRLRHLIKNPSIPSAVPASGKRLEGLRLLVAEDNVVNQWLLKEMLLSEGAVVTCVNNGRLVVEQLEQHGFQQIDLILMDIQMPEMDGYQATRCCRELAPQLPVIGLTAHALEEERQRCLAVGMVEHLTKPADLEKLVAAIRHHTGRSPNYPGVNKEEGRLDHEALTRRYGDKPGLFGELATVILEANASVPDQLRAAATAGNWADLGKLAHSLRGMSGLLMAHDLEALAQQTERAARISDSHAQNLGLTLAATLENLLAEVARLEDSSPPVADG